MPTAPAPGFAALGLRQPEDLKRWVRIPYRIRAQRIPGIGTFALAAECPRWVKSGNAHNEPMMSAFTPLVECAPGAGQVEARELTG